MAYIVPNSTTERPRETKIGTLEVAHVTRDSDTTFKVKRSKIKVTRPLYSARPTRKAAAAVSEGTYSAWESTTTLRLLGGARGAWAPTGEERGGAYLCRHAYSLLIFGTYTTVINLMQFKRVQSD